MIYSAWRLLKKKFISTTVGLIVGFCCGFAEAKSVQDHLHFRMGMVSSSLGTSIGAAGGAFAVVPSFDIEYETFTSDRKSFVFRGILALDMATTVTRYFFAGVGQRFYLNNRGSALMAVTPDVSVMMRPKFRYYVGWDAGISQAVVNVLTASLQSMTTAIDGGGVAGALYQMSENVSLEASLTMSYAFGFSSVPASGMVMKAFFGGAYAF